MARQLVDDYWLSHCDGYRVETPDGRLGVVAELRFDAGRDAPTELVVFGGAFGNRVTVVPANAVVEVVPRQERVVLGSAPERPRREVRLSLRARLAAALGPGLAHRPIG